MTLGDEPVHTRAGFRTAADRPGLEQIADNPLPTGRQFLTETEETRIRAQEAIG